MDISQTPEVEHKIPLGLCKQACMKLDSLIVDIREIAEDDDIDQSDRDNFKAMAEILGSVYANIVNFASRELAEEEFLAEEIPMDVIESFPGDDDVDIMDQSID